MNPLERGDFCWLGKNEFSEWIKIKDKKIPPIFFKMGEQLIVEYGLNIVL